NSKLKTQNSKLKTQNSKTQNPGAISAFRCAAYSPGGHRPPLQKRPRTREVWGRFFASTPPEIPSEFFPESSMSRYDNGRMFLRTAALVVMLVVESSPAYAAKGVRADTAVLDQQYGDATYYASYFDGRTTASGRVFDGNKAMAAHRSYPFGTVVRVTCLRNKRSV